MNLEQDGFEVVKQFIDAPMIRALQTDLSALVLGQNRGGVRNLDKKSKSIFELAHSTVLINLASQYLSAEPLLVRAIFFNKTSENNWLVSWHQDKTIAVTKRFERPNFGPWSNKEGVLHVQPPLAVLNNMVTFRLHLDDADEDNGCLNVMPKSHLNGLMSQNEINSYVSQHTAVTCKVKQGDVLVMRPHLLHASSKALKPTQRRVIHLEYSCYKLPNGVKWA